MLKAIKYRSVVSKRLLWLIEITVLFWMLRVRTCELNSLFLICCVTLNTANTKEARDIYARFIFPLKRWASIRKLWPLWAVFPRVIGLLNRHADESIERRALRPTPPRHPLLASRVPSQSVISASSSAFVSSQKEIGNMDLSVQIFVEAGVFAASCFCSLPTLSRESSRRGKVNRL